MSEQKPTQARGLEGVVIASSAISLVEGTVGRLSYRGYNIDDLAEKSTFEEVMYLIWYGELPASHQLAEFSDRLRAGRDLPDLAWQVLQALPREGAPIDALRTVVSALALADKDVDNTKRDAVFEKALRLAALFPTIVAAYDRRRRNLDPVSPRADLNHAANMLYMLTGQEPRPEFAHAFDTYLVLAAEHSFNASAFAAMVTISTGSDYYSAIVSAIGTLRGAAHGGANQKAMEMLMEIGTPDNVESFVDKALASKRRLMGMGHRIYKTRDPRARHLARHAATLADVVADHRWFQVADRLDSLSASHPYFAQRNLYPNVEFYSAPVLYSLGLAPDLMPAAFACSRIAGWTAHIQEQLSENRIIRPSADYSGPPMRPYTPVEQRNGSA